MFTDHNNSNNDIDEEEKVYFYSIYIDEKTMGIKTFYLTKGKIRIRQGFKSENCGNQGNSTVSLIFFYFCFPTNVFLIASRCNSRRKSITNHFDNSVKSFLFFRLIFMVHKYYIGIILSHLFLAIPSSNEG